MTRATPNDNMDIDNDSDTTLPPDPVSAPLLYIAAEAQQLIGTINKLTALGIEDGDIQLPKIAVAGDQSTGKSSIVESLTAVQMPRSAGTCTRVPFHVVTKTSNSPWTCTISLEKDHIYDLTRPSDPWRPLKETISIPFTTITNPDMLEEWLRRAQAALLNPNQKHDVFKTCGLDDLDTLAAEFSPCQVRIDISSSDVADLAFYDLPGIIASSLHDGIDLPDFIRKLVTRYISASNNIILLVMPFNNDCENCSAFAMVKKLKATSRTVGILTKPDLIDTHAPYKDWIAMLDGTRQPLGHGYYVVKNPNQQELNMQVSRSEALQRETHFFNTREPWNTEFRRFHDRFGSAKIQDQLSTLLVSEIRRTLPNIALKIQQKLQHIDTELNYLPKPPGPKSLTIIMDLLNEMSLSLSDVLRGTFPRTDCINGWHGLVQQLKSDLSATKPQLKSSSKITTAKISDTIDLCDSDDDPAATISPSKKRPATSSTPSPKKQKSQSNGAYIKRDPSEVTSFSSHDEPGHQTAQTFTIPELKSLMRRIDPSGFRGNFDPRAIAVLATPATEMWNQPTSNFLSAAAELLESQMSKVFQEHLYKWESSPIATRLPQEARTMVHKVVSEVRDNAIRSLHAEQITPMIVIDDKAVDSALEEELAELAVSRRKILLKRYFDALDKKSGKATSSADRLAKGAKLSDDDLPADTASTELNLLATANAYLEVSINTLVAHIGRQVLYAFEQVRHPQRGLIAQLKEKWVEEGGLEMCQSLLEVNEAQARERVRLEKEKVKLLEAQKALSEVMAGNVVPKHGAALAHR